jgi:probable F420-dependent oxidoreductase
MKFMIDYPVSSKADGGAWLEPENVMKFSQVIESLGIDAIAFTDHPAPSKKWLDGGGHETFDPFAALSFCAAVTSRIRLMTHLSVVPYRNPFLQAKSMTTVDVLSRGRTSFILGTGYLRSEFAALGVDFDERNELFDESIQALKGIWSTDSYSFVGRHFDSVAQTMQPMPVQRPHPPLWIGGNSVKARERLAEWGDGWAALVGSVQVTSTSRTPSIRGPADLAPMIRDIEDRLHAHGRRLSDVDIMSSSPGTTLSIEMPSDQRVDHIGEMASLGVTWMQLTVRKESFDECVDSISDFVNHVASRFDR